MSESLVECSHGPLSTTHECAGLLREEFLRFPLAAANNPPRRCV